MAKFSGLDNDGQIELISDTPRKEFVYRAIDIYASAGNYRTAEQYGQVLILPLASFFSEQDVRKTLEAVLGNSQISYGSGTPDVVLELFKLTHGLIEQTRPHWQAFVDEMTDQNGGKIDAHYSYPEIRTRLDSL